MDVMDAILARASYRGGYQEKAVSREDLRAVMEGAGRALGLQ